MTLNNQTPHRLLKHKSSHAFVCLRSAGGVSVSLNLEKAPVAGEPIRFIMKVINRQSVTAAMKVHVNAQAKEYNHSPADTFWESHGIIQLAPKEGNTPFRCFFEGHRLFCFLI